MGACLDVLDMVITAHRRDEVTLDRLGALMQQLIEGVLGVRPQLAPQHRTGRVVDHLAIVGHRLAVGFHLQLLEVACEVLQATVVGQDGVGADIEEVVVPDTSQRQQHRQVVFQRRGAEVLIQLMRPGQQATEVVHADIERDGQTDGAPQRIAAADPIPEQQLMFRRDAPLGHLFRLGGSADEVLTVDQRFQAPFRVEA